MEHEHPRRTRLDRHAAATFLARTFRDFKGDLQRLHRNFPAVLQTIINAWREKPETRRHQLQVLARIYRKGDHYVRFLIEHLFVRSMHGLERRYSPAQWTRFYAQVPGTLQKIYVHQKTQ